jgi:hypothetical protein
LTTARRAANIANHTSSRTCRPEAIKRPSYNLDLDADTIGPVDDRHTLVGA